MNIVQGILHAFSIPGWKSMSALHILLFHLCSLRSGAVWQARSVTLLAHRLNAKDHNPTAEASFSALNNTTNPEQQVTSAISFNTINKYYRATVPPPCWLTADQAL